MNTDVAPPLAAQDRSLSAQKDNVDQLSEISRNSQTTFIALILACVYSYLAIATTTDAALISNSSATPLPIIQVNVPIVWFYYFAPIILAVLYAYFHLYLERFWRCLSRLPLWHPDGRGLDDYIYPWLISSTFIRGGIPQLSSQRTSARMEAWLSLLLAWWLVPIVLLFYWARYLAAHDWVGTLLHVGLILVTAAFSLRFYFTAKNALLAMSVAPRVNSPEPTAPAQLRLTRRQRIIAVLGLALLTAALAYFSAAAIEGLLEQTCRKSAADSQCSFYLPGQRAWQVLGLAPRSEVKEQRFVTKPEHWHKLMADPPALASYLEAQRTLFLDRRDLRNMNAESAFLPGSRLQRSTLEYAGLQHAVLTGSRLEDISLRGANLEDADLQYSRIINVQFDDVFAPAAHFDHARFEGATADNRTRLSGDFSGAFFDEAEGGYLLFRSVGDADTSLRDSSFRETKFAWAEFERIDLSGAKFEDATITNSRFTDSDFSNATIRGARLDLSTFTRCRFISPRIEDAFFIDTKFIGSDFENTKAYLYEPGAATLPRVPRMVILRFHGSNAQFLQGTKIRNTQFKGADLRFAVFREVELRNVAFTDKSDLSFAKFADVDLSAVDFADTDLSNADLSAASGVSARALEGACGNGETLLPPGLKIRPCQRN